MNDYRTIFISRKPDEESSRGFGIVIGANQISGADFAQRVQRCLEMQQREGFELVHAQATAEEGGATGMLAIFRRQATGSRTQE